ncbi:hypothetical protein PUR61_02215 [Streptomyces sp. BE20]|uniref:imine reductase family protein n=1 Tax=Streptomyces sp. BE20 TaxID=3002525 RepID=UPI002E77D45E|nr:hypothetical protein [Streptomyces sp. BE20]MEE1821021.1 hypothetical protein [Streptomyces sp. BE20]
MRPIPEVCSFSSTIARQRANASTTAASMPGFLSFYAPRITAGHHGGDVDRLVMAAASLDHVLHTVEASGVDGALPRLLADTFRRGVEAGHGGSSATA